MITTGARKEALDMLEIFGEGNYYLELQDQGLEEEASDTPGYEEALTMRRGYLSLPPMTYTMSDGRIPLHRTC